MPRYPYRCTACGAEFEVSRSMRDANHRTGKKYMGAVPPDKRGQSGAHGRRVAPPERDASKRESAGIFRERLDAVLSDPAYVAMREEHRRLYESQPTGEK